jgi:hypothetical protein
MKHHKQLLIFIMLSFITLGLLIAPLTSATNYQIGFPVLNTNSQNLPAGTWIIQTNQDYNLAYNLNEGFIIQDIQSNLNVTFQVTSGTLYGTGNLNVTTGGGIFLFTPTTSGDLSITSTISSFYATVNGQQLTGSSMTFVAGTRYMVYWQYSNAPPPFVVGLQHTVFYFRSDTFNTNNIIAFGLDPTNTNSQQTITTEFTTGQTVTYGFRVWLSHSHTAATELTGGTPIAQMSRSTTGAGWQNNTWLCPDMPLTLGSEALKVTLYISTDAGNNWNALATYISHSLINPELLHQTWTFILYTTYTTSTGFTTVVFGSNTYPSNINNVGLQPPTQTQIQTYRFLSGEYVLFILSTYTYLIGPTAYLLILMIPTVSLYLRHRNFGPILVLFTLFGSSGGIIWVFVPPWASTAIDILLILGCSFLVWKLLR